MLEYRKEKQINLYSDILGIFTKTGLKTSLESTHLEKKEKLANSKNSP
jgi:hypothetical protein